VLTGSFCLLLALSLAACGGGGPGESGPGAQPSTPPPDNRVSLLQYSATRTPLPQPTHALAAQESDYQFVTAALAASSGNALLLPPLQLSRPALLRAAAQAETLAEQQPLAADPKGLAAGPTERELLALDSTRFHAEFLQRSERGDGTAQAPSAWTARSLTDWQGWLGGDLRIGASSTLMVRERLEMNARWTLPAEPYDGVFEQADGQRDLRPMWRIAGPVWRIDESRFSAKGLLLADGAQLIALWPRQGRLAAFERQGLGEALLRLNQRLRAGIAPAPGTWNLAIGSPSFGSAQPELALGRAGDPARAQLEGLNGSPQFATADRPTLSLRWDDQGLHLSGTQSLAFHEMAGSSGQDTGGGTTRIDEPLLPNVSCPSGEPDLRPLLLLALDAQHRLVMLARIENQGEPSARCEP
jgi:hypothetical protein